MCLSPRFIKHNAFKMTGPRRLALPPSPRSPSGLAPTAPSRWRSRRPWAPRSSLCGLCTEKHCSSVSSLCVSCRAVVLPRTPRVSVSWCKATSTLSSRVNPGASTRPAARRMSVMDAVLHSAAPTAEPNCSGAPHSEEGQPLSV